MLNTSKLRSGRFITEFPVFYGWVVLGAATLGYVMAIVGANSALALVLDDLIAEFHTNRTTMSGLLGLGGFVAAFALPWVGRLVDRFGGRIVGLLSGLLYALSLIGLSLAGSPLTFLLMIVFMQTVGARPLQIINSTVVAQWFRSSRGRVMGVMVIALWLLQSVYVPTLQRLLEIYDWRSIWRTVALVLALGVVPLIWLLMRDRPEQYGLQPDGVSPVSDAEAVYEGDSWTLREARRTPIFWIFAMGRMLIPAMGSSLMLHQVSIFGLLGHSPAVTAQTFSMIAIVAAIGSILAGYLMDRVRPGLMMMAQLAGMLISAVLANTMTTDWMLALYAFSFGMSIATGNVFDNVVWANLFGRRYLGEIRGFVTIFKSIGITMGPVLFGWCFDTYGNYRLMFAIFGALFLVQMVFAYLAPQPQRSVDESGPDQEDQHPQDNREYQVFAAPGDEDAEDASDQVRIVR